MKSVTEIYEQMLDQNYLGLDKWAHHLSVYDRFLTGHEPVEGETFTLVNFSESIDSGLLFHRLLSSWGLEDFRVFQVYKYSEKDPTELAEAGVFSEQGDYEDDGYLAKLYNRLGRIDVLIDDTHYTNSQRTIFKTLYSRMPAGSLYFVEDTYFNYRTTHINCQPTFMEMMQTMIQRLDEWQSNQMDDNQFREPHWKRDIEYTNVSEFPRQTTGIHFFNGMVLLEKDSVEAPSQLVKKWGKPT